MPVLGVRSAWGCMLFLVACHHGEGNSHSGAAQNDASAPTPRASIEANALPSAALAQSSAREAEARALLERWLAAQNELDFEAYSALYADRFVGVKRVSDQAFRFSRKGWLVDRKPMFVKGLSVAVQDLKLQASPDTVVATFTQQFSSASYRDSGKKSLVFLATPVGLRIAREELMRSEVLGGGGSTSALPGFFVALPEGIVLRSRIEARWVSAARRAEPFDDRPLTLADVTLPAEVKVMLGRTFHVARAVALGAKAPSECETKVSAIEIQNSAGGLNLGAIRQISDDIAVGSFVLGRIAVRCEGALWATEEPLPEQSLPRRAEPELSRAAVDAYRREPAYASLQAAYLKQATGDAVTRGRWDEGASGKQKAYVVKQGGGSELVVVTGQRDDGCAGFPASLTVLFENRAGAGGLRSLGVLDQGNFVGAPRTGFDLDKDGQFELVFGPSGDMQAIQVLIWNQGKARLSVSYQAPYYGCTC